MSVDYKDTVFLPKTDFPMKAGLAKREPEILERWKKLDIHARLRADSKGREKFILHDGPPYANGHLHIGHALNKILKDVITRSQQMLGKDSNYVPGWDCHGLPIEWKIEEQYREKGEDKDAVPVIDFRAECREFASHWIDVQSEEFQRLGVTGDWDDPYTTMTFAAEAQITRELMKFVRNGLLYRGSKPVMWSVVEMTALAEAEVEYHDHVSDTIWVKFPVVDFAAKYERIGVEHVWDQETGQLEPTGTGPIENFEKREHEFAAEYDSLAGASVVIWTTTPWTIPGNRAIAFSGAIQYGLYEVTEAPEDNWAQPGDKLILADELAEQVRGDCRIDAWTRVADVATDTLARLTCAHPFRGRGYDFDVPLFEGNHVTAEAGTGFVHTAPGHGTDDFEVWTAHGQLLAERGIDARIPYTVGPDGRFTGEAPSLEGKQVITEKGDKGDANGAVIEILMETGALIGRGRLTHQYPHSWRSKKPLIFRNTPQWFIGMDAGYGEHGRSLRDVALGAIQETDFFPASGRNRLYAMIENRPDWVISRQRAWGVPIAVFVHKKTGEILRDEAVLDRVVEAVEAEGADAWFSSDAGRFLGNAYDADEYEQVFDILDVWFESGATHSFVLEERDDLKWPADLYLEGTDQHRGWFHSSLLESCGTRDRAPYDQVLTHGFVMGEDGYKMSKSQGNIVSPQDVVNTNGADILRLWVVASDYSEDLRIGPEIIKHHTDIYRRLRNTLRFLLGNLNGFHDGERLPEAEMPELDRWVLHRLRELDGALREACASYEFHDFFTELHNFCTVDLSAFYFDIRKDALYCDRADSINRRAARTVLDHLFSCLTAWLAPFICFTAEEAWLARFPGEEESVHLRTFPDVPDAWRDDELAAKWRKIRDLRRVVTGALEIERGEKRIGSSLQSAPKIYADGGHLAAVDGMDVAEIAITSDVELIEGAPPADAFTLDDVTGVGVVHALAAGEKCVRCYKVLPEVGTVAGHPEICNRCADAVEHFPAAAE